MTDTLWRRDEIESPCIKICQIHPAERVCTGCLRTVNEITLWSRMSHDERRAVMDTLPERRGRLGIRRGGRAARRARSGT